MWPAWEVGMLVVLIRAGAEAVEEERRRIESLVAWQAW